MEADSEGIYSSLIFPEAPEARPYTYIDMVSTIDGKIVSGSRLEDVSDLGSKLDHALVRRIAGVSDAVIVGAGTVRSTSPKWDPGTALRIVVTKSGQVPFDSAFFSGASYLAIPASAVVNCPAGITKIVCGEQNVNLPELMKRLRDLEVRRLFVLGGSNLNGQLLRDNLVDELFLTVAPKVKLGSGLPTYAGGEAFLKGSLPSFELVEHHVVSNEVFLRYRRSFA